MGTVERQRALAMALAAATTLHAGAAAAQDVDTFEISGGLFDNLGTLQLEHPNLTRPGALYAGLATTYANDPLVAVDADGNETAIVSDQLGLRLAAGYAVAAPVRIDVRLPLYPVNNVSGTSAFSLGNLRLQAVISALTYEDEGIAFAVVPRLDLPTGDGAAFTGGTFSGGLTAALGGTAGIVGWATNLGFGIGQPADIGELHFGSNLDMGAGLSVAAMDELKIGAEVTTALSLAGLDTYNANPVELHGYGTYAMESGLVATLGAGTGIVAGVGAPDFRLIAAVGYHHRGGPADMDRDGVTDDVDGCLDEPEDIDQFEDEDGCPEPDNDGDGFLDAADVCPVQAEDLDGFRDDDGCPDPDNDGDGLVDMDDTCPDQVGSVAAGGCPDRDNDGVADLEDACPDVAGPKGQGGCPDRDGDGLNDTIDKCPDVPGAPDTEGCPDRDQDKVPDYRDQCPDEPIDARVDPARSDGCPSRVVVTKDKIEISERVFFDTGRSTIQARSFSLLDDVAKVFQANLDITKVEVAGHTDSQGSDASNLKLSQSRAEAVVVYLIGKGIDPARLDAKGYGESTPIADNATSAGRAENRRVEFVILSTSAE
jgi:outer membrane protein OmpA-like peptidoglycan-associated protein